ACHTWLLAPATANRQQFVSAIAWWAVAGAGFFGGWAAAAYLIAAARERDVIYRLAQKVLIGLVFVAATVGGIMSKTGNLGGTVDVIAGLTAGFARVFCGFFWVRARCLDPPPEYPERRVPC